MGRKALTRKEQMMKKNLRLWLAVLTVCLLLFTAGCGASEDATEAPSATAISGAEELDDGREVGGYASGAIGDTMTNVFFAYSVNDAYLAAEYEGEVPEEGYVWLVAEITVKNISDETLPMYSDDFQVQWGEGDEDYGFPIAKFSSAQMEDEYELPEGESVTKLVVYEVPLLEGENEYSISYLEYYDDDVEGNVFFVYFDLSMS
jgi:hypothetical protein